MYYSASTIFQNSRHCVGAAFSDDILGPYAPQNSPLFCPISQGGAIDAAGYNDKGQRYIVYKVVGETQALTLCIPLNVNLIRMVTQLGMAAFVAIPVCHPRFCHVSERLTRLRPSCCSNPHTAASGRRGRRRSTRRLNDTTG